MDDLIYLACPYTHPDQKVVDMRFRTANKVAGLLMSKGHNVYSPISHTHPIAVEVDLPTTWDYWESFDRAMLRRCTSLLVIKIDGWDISKGVRSEIKIAQEYGLPVRLVTEEGVLSEMVSLLGESF